MSVPAAYLGVIPIWSTTPLAIKWSGKDVGFLFGVTSRMLMGVVVGLCITWLLHVPERVCRTGRFGNKYYTYNRRVKTEWATVKG